MAQYIVPTGDKTTGDWTSTPLYDKIDNGIEGGTPNDATNINWNEPGNATASVWLSGISDPNDNTNHILRLRTRINTFGGTDTIDVSLYDDSTEIYSESVTTTGSFSQFYLNVINIPEASGANITNYDKLNVQFTANVTSTQISEIELELPSGGGGGGGEDSTVSDFVRFENGCMSDFRGMVNIRG